MTASTSTNEAPRRSVLALFSHPDDIEFVAAGTLLRLKATGWQIHYMNLANGCCGSNETDRATTAQIRLREAQQSAAILGATFYPPICDDLDVFYNRENLAKVAAVVRCANPSIVLTHARHDYMEDHMEACRLAVTAAFTRSVPNYQTDPQQSPVDGDIALYHAQPHGNRTPDNRLAIPTYVVSIDEVMETKLAMLSCHQSQQNWLASTQKMNSYLQTMLDLNAEVAQITHAPSQYAEGWNKHLHLGYGPQDWDPLLEIATATNTQFLS
ncbi:PIG-L deacetylase family protein [Pirellulaceae bacterium SH467]|jgi:LmbE family N-acetylglucosaminyl deacetylase